MKGFLEFWNRFWFSTFDPLPLSIFRVFLGALTFAFYIGNYPNWERFYSAEGIPSLITSELIRNNWWTIFSWTEGLIPIKIYWWIALFCSILFTIGLKTRFATILLYIIQTSMNIRDNSVINGEDLIFRMLLFYSCFAPLNHCLSIDNLLNKKKKHKSLPIVWALRAMQINVALIYLVNVPNKLTHDIAWLNGEALYWTVVNGMWSYGVLGELFCKWNCLISKIGTYGSLFIEGTFPIFVCFKETRIFSIAALAALHIGIAIFLANVTFFTLAMVCAMWLFVPGGFVRRKFKF